MAKIDNNLNIWLASAASVNKTGQRSGYAMVRRLKSATAVGVIIFSILAIIIIVNYYYYNYHPIRP